MFSPQPPGLCVHLLDSPEDLVHHLVPGHVAGHLQLHRVGLARFQRLHDGGEMLIKRYSTFEGFDNDFSNTFDSSPPLYLV